MKIYKQSFVKKGRGFPMKGSRHTGSIKSTSKYFSPFWSYDPCKVQTEKNKTTNSFIELCMFKNKRKH